MTIDKQKIKALALGFPNQETIQVGTAEYESYWAWVEYVRENFLGDHLMALAFLAEIERLEQYAEVEAKGSDAAAQDLIRLVRENRKLKAENEALLEGANFRAIQSLRADCEALRKDAERYRWLCNGNGYFLEEAGLCGHSNEKPQADREIDEAMAREAK